MVVKIKNKNKNKVYLGLLISIEINPNSQPMRNKKIEKSTRQRKTITWTRQYLRGSVICLCLRSCKDFTIIKEEYKVQLQPSLHSMN